MRSDRNRRTSEKYRRSEYLKGQDFSGDSRDQRSFMLWCGWWMSEALQASRSGAALLSFIDWRNLPCLIDAVQAAGWVYRGISVWDKKTGRPDQGWFRSQCEYIVSATNGPVTRGPDAAGRCSPGVFRHAVGSKKQHITEKPVELLREVLSTRADWRFVVDPFMGSGTTLRAAKDLGKRAVGIEISEAYCEIAAARCEQEPLDFGEKNPRAPDGQDELGLDVTSGPEGV